MKTPNFLIFSILVVTASVAGCSKKNPDAEPAQGAKTPEVASAASENPKAVQPVAAPQAPAAMASDVQITWTDPPEWKRVPPKNAMRKATYEIPAATGEAEGAELSVFYFGPGQGGSVDQNIDRWTGQFQGLKKEQAQRAERVVNDLTQHTVEVVSGTFAGTSMGPHAPPQGAKEGQGLLGAVVESPSGLYFFKLSGGTKTVQAAKKPFFALLDSVKAKGH